MRRIFSKSIFQTEPDYFGLDLSDSSIKWVQFTQGKKGKLKPVVFYNQRIEKGLIENGTIKNKKKLSEVLKNMYQTLKKKYCLFGYAVFSLPEQETFIRVIQIPRIEKSSIETAVRFEAEENIPLGINDIYIDWEVVASPAMPDHLDVVLAAIPKRTVGDYADVLRDAGISIAAFEPESQAIARALIKNHQSIAPILMVDFGANSTSLTVFSGKTLRLTTTISISGKQLDEALASKLNVSLEEAEKVKFSVDLKNEPKNDEKVAAVIPIINDFSQKISDYIAFYKSHSAHEHLSNSSVSGIVLCGGDSKLIGLLEYLSKNLDLKVKAGDSLVNIELNKGSKIKIPEKELPCYTTAIGLALRQT